MLHREGRIDNPQATQVRRVKLVTVRSWETSIFVFAFFVILILGIIAGVNGLTALLH